MLENNTISANYNGDRIECGKCGALLAMKKYPHGIGEFRGESATEFKRSMDIPYSNKYESDSNVIEIKCKERKDGVTCNQLNYIVL